MVFGMDSHNYDSLMSVGEIAAYDAFKANLSGHECRHILDHDGPLDEVLETPVGAGVGFYPDYVSALGSVSAAGGGEGGDIVPVDDNGGYYSVSSDNEGDGLGPAAGVVVAVAASGPSSAKGPFMGKVPVRVEKPKQVAARAIRNVTALAGDKRPSVGGLRLPAVRATDVAGAVTKKKEKSSSYKKDWDMRSYSGGLFPPTVKPEPYSVDAEGKRVRRFSVESRSSLRSYYVAANFSGSTRHSKSRK